ncbi:dTDP-4-dehydrorhamnose 3,5-epimerase [Pseudohalocynthiibacter sp. F2068]|jgi:dTDP-4-dehydrorhamnose 3,5-epimerase|uniref:dTDP-4-dehydrorhamnose 3,5-epimerase n=1 Tax=Pseudohalocynthiibacter sp. F2068 TaxID=2926418 RepID=UPI001FF117C2|nr:dTDP-4-dehydrorhamnose 3,5-epimerase [Pseudohalocynthiibacter sp. F2068]MCK0103891.1 dTDP-4-dehydrorhamnose 3,5-epimerase [Pseudohalocynthiibacter sp. F2068]
MIFSETKLKSAFVIDLQELSDDRGFFARAFCAREFEDHGLNPTVAQGNLSYNHKKGTMRGLHFQAPPAAETKLVRCTAGAIWDVIVDLRPDSPTHMQHFGVELTSSNRRALYVPEMFAHGYLTLIDDAEVTYSVGEFYTPGVEGGYRFDDPALGINWPVDVVVISEKDAAWPLIEGTTR